DLGAELARLRVTGLCDPVRNRRAARVRLRCRCGRHDRIPAIRLDGQGSNALIAVEVCGLALLALLACACPLAALLTARGLEADVLEQIALLLLEVAALAGCGPRLRRRGAAAQIRDLPDGAVRERDAEHVVVA